jgi:hypothetical protein
VLLPSVQAAEYSSTASSYLMLLTYEIISLIVTRGLAIYFTVAFKLFHNDGGMTHCLTVKSDFEIGLSINKTSRP